MYFRVKRTGAYAYLQIVESFREQGHVHQRVLSTVGRVDALQASGQLDALMRSGLRFALQLELPVRPACASLREMSPLRDQLLAGSLDAEGLRLTFKPFLKAERHSFERALPIAEPLQVGGEERQELIPAEQPPLDDVNQFVEMEGLVLSAVSTHEISMEESHARQSHPLNGTKASQTHRRQRWHRHRWHTNHLGTSQRHPVEVIRQPPETEQYHRPRRRCMLGQGLANPAYELGINDSKFLLSHRASYRAASLRPGRLFGFFGLCSGLCLQSVAERGKSPSQAKLPSLPFPLLD